MPTVVVNLRTEPYDVYCGRAGHGQTGYFGNPVELRRPCPECHGLHLTGGQTLPCYRRYLERRLSHDWLFRRRVAQLSGRRLGCFCKSRACHCDVLAEWADRLARRYVRVDFSRACWCVTGRHTQCKQCYGGDGESCTCRACDAQTGSVVRRVGDLPGRRITGGHLQRRRHEYQEHPDPWADADDDPSEIEILGVVGSR